MVMTEQSSTDLSRRLFSVRRVRPEEIAQTQTHILRVLEEDLGVGYVPEWHYDLDDIQGVYIDNPRQALFLAVDDESGAISTGLGGVNQRPGNARLSSRNRSSDAASSGTSSSS